MVLSHATPTTVNPTDPKDPNATAVHTYRLRSRDTATLQGPHIYYILLDSGASRG